MRRRHFMALLAGAAAMPALARPRVAAAEPATPVIGFLDGHTSGEVGDLVDALRKGLSDYGYVVGRDVTIEARWAEQHYERLPELAAELVGRKVAVIVAGDNLAALAAKKATATIPIVFTSDGGPVALGLVSSLNRPGGNVTGVGLFSGALSAKRLTLLRELVPSAQLIGVLGDRLSVAYPGQRKEAQDAARSLGLRLSVKGAGDAREIEAAFAALAKEQVRALMVAPSSNFTWNLRDQIVGLAARHAIPAIYSVRQWTAAGGLMNYGADLADSYHQVGVYVAKLLKGASVADLPVEQSSRFDFVINAKTAKALGLTVPAKLLALADEVIE